jgi:hypothetical protein
MEGLASPQVMAAQDESDERHIYLRSIEVSDPEGFFRHVKACTGGKDEKSTWRYGSPDSSSQPVGRCAVHRHITL